MISWDCSGLGALGLDACAVELTCTGLWSMLFGLGWELITREIPENDSGGPGRV